MPVCIGQIVLNGYSDDKKGNLKKSVSIWVYDKMKEKPMVHIWKMDKLDSGDKIAFLGQSVSGHHIEKEHGHEFMEIAYVAKGRVVQNINGNIFYTQKGDFLFFYVGDTHSFVSEGDAVITNLIFSPSLFDNMMLSGSFLSHKKIDSLVKLPPSDRKRCIDIFNLMKNEYENKDEGYMFVLYSLLSTLICILLRHGYKKAEFNERILIMTKMIEENPTVSVSAIADKVGYSKEYAAKFFREAMGVGIKDYINKKKMEKALSLVIKTDLSVEHIMSEIGLSNRTYFYRIFKNFTGQTPGEVRKR